MYSFDLQNVVPSRDLTCLFSKASIDESNLWHKRLGPVNFKTMNKLVKGNLVRGLRSKIFENDHTCVACQKVSVGNQTYKNVGLQDTNGNAGTQDNVDARKEVSNKHYIVLPLWSSLFSTFKISDDKATDDKPTDDTSSKTVKEPVNKEDQAYRDELDRLMSQENEASDAADALRQEFEQGCIDQRGVTNSGSTNSFNTVSHPVNDASTSGTFSAAGSSSPHLDAFIPANTLLHVDQDDSQIPNLEDIAEL
nr:ribonuclease H-like domain-containing protein [Tanacetum cinerariifolium]